jgi:NADPH-dependent ferric siderophore reductase
MTRIDREHLEGLARKAKALQKVWLRERDERRAMQLAANTEIRRRWIESDSMQSEAELSGQHREEDHVIIIKA